MDHGNTLNKICTLCLADISKETTKSNNYCDKCFNEKFQELNDYEKSQTELFPEIDQITEKIYLGNYDGARDLERLQNLSVSHIMVCGTFLNIHFSDNFVYKQFELEDSYNQDISQHFVEAIKFIENSDKIYVHCFAGISRSAAIVIAYLMWKEKLSAFECKMRVQKKRKSINPNYKFMEQLEKFEAFLKLKNYLILD